MADSHVTELIEMLGEPLGGASGQKRKFNVEFLGKSPNIPNFPYTVANEVVATHIGIALGLNLPNVFVYQKREEAVLLVQMMARDPSMQQEPPATSKALKDFVEANPWEVHGVIIFDLFIANNDRAFGPERRNLFLDTDGRLMLIDQGNACFYRNRSRVGIKAGIPRLEKVEKDLTALFDMDHKKNHYREFLTNWNFVIEWCNRIQQLPDYVIEGALARIPKSISPPSQEERDKLVAFLVKRKGYLLDHIRRWKDKFPGLPNPQGEPS